MTDAAVVALMNNCPGLVEVYFGGCEDVTAEAIERFEEILPNCYIEH